jgi:hypothetical protein
MATNKNPNQKIYSIKNIIISGMKMNVRIKNIAVDEQNVLVECEKRLTKKQLENIKKYLYMEGFNDEAEEYNLGLKA